MSTVTLYSMAEKLADAKEEAVWNDGASLAEALHFVTDALDARAGAVIAEAVRGHCAREARKELFG